ncbi:cell division protein ZipA [Thorsellia kenyensis]|uniref:Cell division protein ZipA n=1 Tax=Thorsellia kenyensis TaxID=1549888 RepID=A0ABV6CAS6_9GAMM
MKENLRIILLVIGVLAIIALFLHGVWSSRKEKSTLFGKKKRVSRRSENDTPSFSEDIDAIDNEVQIHALDTDVSEVRVKKGDAEEHMQMNKDLHSDPSNTITDTEIKLRTDANENHETEVLQNESAITETTDDQTLAEETTAIEEQQEPVEELVIVLHVMGVHNNILRGDLLLNSFLNAGLNYGDMNIFHRHLSTTASPVIFSVANMVKPGTFDPNQMIDFTTIGVTFFMVLPSAGEPIQNFKLMLQSVQRIAEDVGGQVYDDKRQILTQLKTESITQSIRDWMTRTYQNA